MSRPHCQVCRTFPLNGEVECRDCGATLPPYTVIQPPPSLDDAKPQLGPISDLYDQWHGKKVKVKDKPIQGVVTGADSCHGDTNKDGEYLIIKLPEENAFGRRFHYEPVANVEEVK